MGERKLLRGADIEAWLPTRPRSLKDTIAELEVISRFEDRAAEIEELNRVGAPYRDLLDKPLDTSRMIAPALSLIHAESTP